MGSRRNDRYLVETGGSFAATYSPLSVDIVGTVQGLYDIPRTIRCGHCGTEYVADSIKMLKCTQCGAPLEV